MTFEATVATEQRDMINGWIRETYDSLLVHDEEAEEELEQVTKFEEEA